MSVKRYHFVGTLFISSLILIAACRQKSQAPLVPDDYRLWSQTTDIILDYPIPGHESHFRRIYINATGRQVRSTEKNGQTFYEFPEETIIVKEIYGGLEPPGENEEPVLLNAMIKRSQHPKSRGGWLWIAKNYKTGEERTIEYELCVDCHANANERHPYGDRNSEEEFRDYVYFLPVP